MAEVRTRELDVRSSSSKSGGQPSSIHQCHDVNDERQHWQRQIQIRNLLLSIPLPTRRAHRDICKGQMLELDEREVKLGNTFIYPVDKDRLQDLLVAGKKGEKEISLEGLTSLESGSEAPIGLRNLVFNQHSKPVGSPSPLVDCALREELADTDEEDG